MLELEGRKLYVKVYDCLLTSNRQYHHEIYQCPAILDVTFPSVAYKLQNETYHLFLITNHFIFPTSLRRAPLKNPDMRMTWYMASMTSIDPVEGHLAVHLDCP